jgi:transposase
MTTTILSGRERRRRWTSAQKLQIVEETLLKGASVTAIARLHDIHPNLIHGWRRQVRDGVLSGAPAGRAQFVPVTVARTRAGAMPVTTGFDAALAIEIVLRNGRMLRVPDGVAPARVVVLADALEGIGR